MPPVTAPACSSLSSSVGLVSGSSAEWLVFSSLFCKHSALGRSAGQPDPVERVSLGLQLARLRIVRGRRREVLISARHGAGLLVREFVLMLDLGIVVAHLRFSFLWSRHAWRLHAISGFRCPLITGQRNLSTLEEVDWPSQRARVPHRSPVTGRPAQKNLLEQNPACNLIGLGVAQFAVSIAFGAILHYPVHQVVHRDLLVRT